MLLPTTIEQPKALASGPPSPPPELELEDPLLLEPASPLLPDSDELLLEPVIPLLPDSDEPLVAELLDDDVLVDVLEVCDEEVALELLDAPVDVVPSMFPASLPTKVPAPPEQPTAMPAPNTTSKRLAAARPSNMHTSEIRTPRLPVAHKVEVEVFVQACGARRLRNNPR